MLLCLTELDRQTGARVQGMSYFIRDKLSILCMCIRRFDLIPSIATITQYVVTHDFETRSHSHYDKIFHETNLAISC